MPKFGANWASVPICRQKTFNTSFELENSRSKDFFLFQIIHTNTETKVVYVKTFTQKILTFYTRRKKRKK